MMTNGGRWQGKWREERLANEQRNECVLTWHLGSDSTKCCTMGKGGRALSFSGGKRCRAELSCDWRDSQEFSTGNKQRTGTCCKVVRLLISGICV